MDIEFDKIKEIRMSMGLEYNNTPTDFILKNKTSYIEPISKYKNDFFEKNKEGNLDECIRDLTLIIYHILDILVQQGIYPDTIMSLMIYDDLQKIWPDKKKHFDKKGKEIYPEGYKSISKDIDTEIMSMQVEYYSKIKLSVTRYYNDIVNYFKLAGIEYSKTPSLLKEKECKHYDTELYNYLIIRYANSDYLEEEAEWLISALYETMKVFVKMGVNPEEYLDKLIEEKKQELSNGKSK